jgi:hypothetical protein
MKINKGYLGDTRKIIEALNKLQDQSTRMAANTAIHLLDLLEQEGYDTFYEDNSKGEKK